jgi:lambda family phage portal protein/HK97 family phage prohead protease
MGRIILPDSVRRKRLWDAAGNNRLTTGWLSTLQNPADELRQALPVLRARSRQLANNNEYARRFLTAVQVNVAGPNGITLQSRVGAAGSARSQDIDRKVERAWAEWCRAGTATIDGRMSFAQWLGFMVRTTARDGECVALHVTGRSAANRFGYALQSLDVSQIDDQKVSRTPRIFMGVEHDDGQRAVAYHIKGDEATHLAGAQTVRAERIEAKRILHTFIVERSLLRGVPWMAPIMLRLHMVNGYQEAEVTAARIAASKMGFYTRSPEASELDPDGTDEEGRPISEVEPGTFEALPAGWDVKAFDSQHPTTAYGAFMTSCLQGIAAGLGISYHALTGDLSQANYSSLREAKLVEADVWRSLQQWLIDSVCRPVFARWLEMAITTGALNVSMSDYQRIVEASTWQPRGWAWVDPEKEMAAYEKALALNLMTRTEILAAQGKDYEETLEQIEREKALAAAIAVEELRAAERARSIMDRATDADAKPAPEIAERRAALAAKRRALSALTTKLGAIEQRCRAADRSLATQSRAEGMTFAADARGQRMTRQAQITASGSLTRDGAEQRTFELAFSSEEPVDRWFGVEVLDHDPSSVDLSFAGSQRAPLLFNHDPDRIIGRVVSARVQARRGRATVELPAGDPEAEWAWAKVRAGTLTNVSVGYIIEQTREATDTTGRPVVRVTRWKPIEISLVSVPADTTVGVGRST